MVLTSCDYTGHRGEGERGELDRDELLQQHQPTKISYYLVTDCWAGSGGGKHAQGLAARQAFLAGHAQHTVSSTVDDKTNA